MYVSSHETTSSAFTWATHLLAKYPEVQSRLREEIRANLPSPSALQDPTTDLAGTLENLPYLNAVCNETLRLYPTVPVTIRIATRPTTIHSQHIPQGTRIYIAPWAINRSPDHWGPDANEYRPERWIDPDTGRSNNSGGVSSNYSNLTFLHGPRSCIGERFAKSELKALIAVFCGTFQMSMADPNEVPIPYGAITTKPKNGMRLRLQVLDGW
jgi:cytochrome P450